MMRKVRVMRNTASRASGASNPGTLRLLAPAKINLHLRVGPRREDGFHPLLTWMATVGLFDTLSFSTTSPLAIPLSTTPTQSLKNEITENRSDGVVMTSDDPSLPCDGRNLVVKAANQVRQFLSARRAQMPQAEMPAGKNAEATAGLFVSIHLEKRIPAGGGLGGGSSDAACTLLGLQRLWVARPEADRLWVNEEANEVGEAGRAGEFDRPGERSEEIRGSGPPDSLSELAARLGSDVPFFLYGPSSVCKGRGESVRPIGVPASVKWVTLVLPPIGMPTADVYRRFDQMNLGREQDVEREPSWNEWVNLGSRSLLSKLVNDLEAPAFDLRPDLGRLRADIEQALGRPVRMSGSGSSLFTLFDEQSEAISAAETITAHRQVRAVAIELCPTIPEATTPAR
jgi:4-diphosphocytidyl-2-C-methyl-D-erythritol kinase